ncbi:MarC family protein [Abyssibius alkaniclasticus]|uniref:MarC family protein n=1 Tax=Abyssibius alkaniclasticus TaxID=2881234 RepID=UPI002363A8B7|nr:MarC family protein [Abyssibius alkaniclasticus]UPH70597.1 MarC family protein [Abyssibius alkaniclasticus]
MQELELAFAVFVTLFVVVDPIGLAPLFVALTDGMDVQKRRRIALRACLVAAAILALFGLVGEDLLGAVGISMPAFRISGGVLLFITALDMLFERRTQRRENNANSENDPSVFPLAMPLLAGPGAMTSMILLTGEHPDVTGQAIVFSVMFAILILVFAMFLVSGILAKAMGRTGIMVTTRLFGIFLSALSVQFILDGLSDFGLVPG